MAVRKSILALGTGTTPLTMVLGPLLVNIVQLVKQISYVLQSDRDKTYTLSLDNAVDESPRQASSEGRIRTVLREKMWRFRTRSPSPWHG